MTKEQAKQEIKSRVIATRYLTKSKGGLYNCPYCDSGTGPNETGAVKYYPETNTFCCHACKQTGDVIDLYQKITGTDFNTALMDLAKEAGIQIDDAGALSTATRALAEKRGAGSDSNGGKFSAPPAPQGKQADKQAASHALSPQEIEKVQAFVTAANKRIIGSAGQAYLNGRGISDESISRFRLGYNAASNAIVIPHNPDGSYYIERNINKKAFYCLKGAEKILFNADALYTDAPCFVVESDLCAISIEQSGGKAVALPDTSKENLLRQVKARKPTAPAIVVSLDNDKAGQKAAKKLTEELESLGVFALQENVSGDCKDPNELLVKDPAALRANVARVAAQAAERAAAAARLQAELEEQARRDYMGKSASGLMDAFIDGIKSSASTPAIPTGFPSLDRRLDGGLYEGLYLIGAISSLGKTTFVHQVADQIARKGHDVLYFSLEMSAFELVAKSISRTTYTMSKARSGTAAGAKTTRGILAGKKWEKYTDEEISLIQEAVSDYDKNCAPRIWIEQGIGDIGVEAVRHRVEEHIRFTGRRPVVIIDYIQILAPSDVRASDKQNTDKNVLELKRLSRDKKIPVICISSLNRDNYTAPISMAAFKESGSLEYGSDVLIGLQHEGMDYREGESDKARDQRIRSMRKENDDKAARGESITVELKVLKNRNGAKGDPIPVLFTPMYNHFAEVATFLPADNIQTPWTGNSTTKKRKVL